MKKWFCVILALVLALSMSACGGKERLAELSDSLTPEQLDPQANAPEGEGVVTMGRMVGGTYTNKYVGFALRLDTDWIFSGAEELQELPENAAEIIAGMAEGEDVPEIAKFTDMYAESPERLASINVQYHKEDEETRASYNTLTDSEIIDLALGEKDALIAAYAQSGITVEKLENLPVTFAGQETAAMYTAAHMDGTYVYILQMLNYDLGEYSVTITITSFDEDITVELLDMFHPLEQ